MSNPPPARSWFRLPNLGRQAQPRPPSPQQLRPPVLRPALAQSFRPTQPQPQPRPPQPPPPPPTTTTTPQPPSPSPQQPRPPVLRPAFAQSFWPTQPQPRPPQPPPPPPATTTTPQPPSPSPQQPRPPILRPAFSQSFRPIQPQPQPRPPQPPPSPPTATIPQPPSPSPTPPRPVAAPSPPVVTSQPPMPPSPPLVVSSPTPPMTSPKTVNATSSEFITKQSPKKPQVSEEKPPPLLPPSSLNSMTNNFSPKSSSYPAIESPGAIKPFPKTSLPSPISLPSKGEPNMVLVQATFNKQAIVPSNSSKYSNVKEADRRMLSSFSEDARNMKVLTIGGENKGANMELGFFSRSSRGGKQTEFNGNGNVGNEVQESEDVHKGIAKTSRLPMNAFVNSNIQSVNSSILLDCSVTHHDPGVHFYFSKKPTKGIGKSNGDEIGLKDNENRNPSIGKKQ